MFQASQFLSTWHKVCFIVCSQLPSAGLSPNISPRCRMDWPYALLVIIPQRQQVFHVPTLLCVLFPLPGSYALLALLMMMNLSSSSSSLSSILNSSERWLDTSHLYSLELLTVLPQVSKSHHIMFYEQLFHVTFKPMISILSTYLQHTISSSPLYLGFLVAQW